MKPKTHSIKFTELEAIEFSFALDKAQQALVEKLGSLRRQRRVPDRVAHERVILFFTDKLNHLIALNDSIQRAAQIRGW